MNAEGIASRLDAKPTSAGWEARCPAHEDRNASLSIAEGTDGRVLLKCHAGCSFGAIVAGMGLKPRDLFPTSRTETARRSRENAPKTKRVYPTIKDALKAVAWGVSKAKGTTYTVTRTDVYRDASGAEVGAGVRLDSEDKTDKVYRPYHHVDDGWVSGDPAGKWPMFRLPKIMTEGGPVFVCEGEKAASAGHDAGLLCTCTAHGSQSASKTNFEPMKGRDVVVLPDNDAAGKAYADDVARLCSEAGAATVRIVILPDLPPKGDLVEFFQAGGTAEDVVKLATEAEPMAFEPMAAEVKQASEDHADGAEDAADVVKVRSVLWGLSQEKISATAYNRRAAAAVVQWLHDRGRFYFVEDCKDFTGVLFFDLKRKLLLRVRSDAFLAWVSDCLSVNRSERVFQFAASAIETEGLSDRATGITPACFWAGQLSGSHPAIYISSGAGQMARITAAGVQVVDNGTDDVLFPAENVLEPWNLVEDGRDPFEACRIFSDMATSTPHGQEIVRLWTAGMFADFACKPPMCVTAPVGAGKTAVIRGIFALLGLDENINAVNKNGEGDFWATLDGGGLACFDNADTRIDWLPDALAAAATAGSHQKRKLYTDADRVTLRPRAAVAITSANPAFASDAGLADRLLVVRLRRREGATAESELFNEVRAGRDEGLTYIARTLSRALADTRPTPAGLNARHPDFASFAVKIGRAMGRGDEAVNALRAAEVDKGLFCLQNDSIGAALLEAVDEPFNGTAAALLEKIKAVDESFDGRLSTKRLSKRLEKLWPHLQATFKAKKEKGHGGINRISLSPPENGCFGGFETLFSGKSPTRRNIETFAKTPLESHQSHQGAEPTTPTPEPERTPERPAEADPWEGTELPLMTTFR